MGPLLFLVYINDLPDGLNSTPRLFADDGLIYKVINSPDDTVALQRDLDKLQQWEKTW